MLVDRYHDFYLMIWLKSLDFTHRDGTVEDSEFILCQKSFYNWVHMFLVADSVSDSNTRKNWAGIHQLS